jgi:pSer/pThr/pTyr-binding forkhead associated (FHA) protein
LIWVLTIEDDEGAVSHRPLAGVRCTVGRAADRDLVLPQANVSRRHARFERRDGRWFVVDEGSENGTFVNGCAIAAPTAVGPGDALQLGGYRLGLSFGETPRRLPPPAPPPTPARLLVITGVAAGAHYAFEQHDFVTIGSDAECSLRLPHERVSPLHATVRSLHGGRYELSDRSGTGLVFVNGRPLVGEQLLEGGDAINVAGVALLRFLEPSQRPDPRFDMVSQPDAWLSIDVSAPDERPTLDEPSDAEEWVEVDADALADEGAPRADAPGGAADRAEGEDGGADSGRPEGHGTLRRLALLMATATAAGAAHWAAAGRGA